MTYRYNHLHSKKFQIRLLTIEPASNAQDPICITLRTVRQPSKHKYVALSYTWGRPSSHLPDNWDDPLVTKAILVNGKVFAVRCNLFSALQTIRHTGDSRCAWWIDAICINQENVGERNREVTRMGEIYNSIPAPTAH